MIHLLRAPGQWPAALARLRCIGRLCRRWGRRATCLWILPGSLLADGLLRCLSRMGFRLAPWCTWLWAVWGSWQFWWSLTARCLWATGLGGPIALRWPQLAVSGAAPASTPAPGDPVVIVVTLHEGTAALVAASARVAVAMATIGWLAAGLALGGLLNAIAASPALFWVSVATVLFGLLPVGQAQAGGDW